MWQVFYAKISINLLVQTKILSFATDIFLVVIFLLPCNILVAYLCPKYLVMAITWWLKVITCNYQFCEIEWSGFLPTFSTKRSVCTILANLSVFEIVLTARIVLYNQCCAALSCTAKPVLYYKLCCVAEKLSLVCVFLNGKTRLILGHILRTFSNKKDIGKHTWNVSINSRLCFGLKLTEDADNADSIQFWPHHYFQQKNVKVLFYQKYRCWSPKNMSPIYCHQICF